MDSEVMSTDPEATSMDPEVMSMDSEAMSTDPEITKQPERRCGQRTKLSGLSNR